MSHSIQNRLFRGAITILCATMIGCGTTPSAHTSHVHTVAISSDSLRSGDLAFRLGRTIESEAIAAGTEKAARYSHIGIVVRQADSITIVHIEPSPNSNEQVRNDRPEDFFAADRAASGAIFRIKNLSERQRDLIEHYALAGTHSLISFDHNYRLSDTTQMYCTELTEWVYLKAGIELSEGRRHRLPLTTEPIILPRDILAREDIDMVWEFTYYSNCDRSDTTDRN